MTKKIGDNVGKIRGHHFGHPISCDMILVSTTPHKAQGGDWYYDDTGEPINNSPKRKCPKCHKYETEEGHDPCIANLPGVDYACCGHGVDEGYVKFSDGNVLRGKFDIKD